MKETFLIFATVQAVGFETPGNVVGAVAAELSLERHVHQLLRVSLAVHECTGVDDTKGRNSAGLVA